jgi:hypothetical protein
MPEPKFTHGGKRNNAGRPFTKRVLALGTTERVTTYQDGHPLEGPVQWQITYISDRTIVFRVEDGRTVVCGDPPDDVSRPGRPFTKRIVTVGMTWPVRVYQGGKLIEGPLIASVTALDRDTVTFSLSDGRTLVLGDS